MLRNNKGSILVTSLMFFTIIITVCLSCVAISSSNNSYSKLQYEHVKMKELAISGIEVTKSNILSKVKYAIEKFDKESSFNDYFLGNMREIIGDVSKAGLNNVSVSINKRETVDSEGNINFVIESVCKEKDYIKRVRANVKILNPWTETGIIQQNNHIEEAKKDEETTTVENKDLNENNKLNEEIIDTTENNRVTINETELVVIYNYEES